MPLNLLTALIKRRTELKDFFIAFLVRTPSHVPDTTVSSSEPLLSKHRFKWFALKYTFRYFFTNAHFPQLSLQGQTGTTTSSFLSNKLFVAFTTFSYNGNVNPVSIVLLPPLIP